MSAPPLLRTRRLTLRPVRNGDAEALFPALSDADCMRWWSRAPFTTIEEARAYLAAEAPGCRRWCIAPDDGDAIGWVSAGERRPGVSEIGYLLHPAHAGRGLAREAVACVIDALFAAGTRRLFADVDPDNRRSCRLLEALGFRLEGRLRGEWETHIGVRDSLIYGLLGADRRGGS